MGNRKWRCQRLHSLHPRWGVLTLLSLSLLSIPQYFDSVFFFLLHLALLSVLSSSQQTPSFVTDPIVYLLYLPPVLPSFSTLHPLQEVFRILWIRHVPAHSGFQRDRHQCAGSTRHAQSRINLHARIHTHTHTREKEIWKKVNSLRILSQTQTNQMCLCSWN